MLHQDGPSFRFLAMTSGIHSYRRSINLICSRRDCRIPSQLEEVGPLEEVGLLEELACIYMLPEDRSSFRLVAMHTGNHSCHHSINLIWLCRYRHRLLQLEEVEVGMFDVGFSRIIGYLPCTAVYQSYDLRV